MATARAAGGRLGRGQGRCCRPVDHPATQSSPGDRPEAEPVTGAPTAFRGVVVVWYVNSK